MKGIAYVGALQVLTEYGYHFDHFVGTSAGAISAALLAAGHSPTNLGEILATTTFRKFKDGWLPLSVLLLLFRKGLYRGEAFRLWLEKHLREQFPQYTTAVPIRFKHLREVANGAKRLTVFASLRDRTNYSFDSQDARNSETEVSFACRCSMAIPYFFRPERIGGKWVVDGGMQNNYPIDALLKNYPDLRESSNFIGLYLGQKDAKQNREWLFLDLLSIWSESGDEEAKEYFIDRTIVIDPRPVRTTDFSLTANDVAFLLAEGRASALRWIYHWSDQTRPTLTIVREAEDEAIRLRNVVIKERWRRFWPKLASSTILSILLLAGLAYVTYEYFAQPNTGSAPLATAVGNGSKSSEETPKDRSEDLAKAPAEAFTDGDLISNEVRQKTEIKPQARDHLGTKKEIYTETRTYRVPGGQRTETTIIMTETALARTDVSDARAISTIAKKKETSTAPRLSALITDDDGTPIKGATVIFTNASELKPVETSDTGVFSISTVPRGLGEVFKIEVVKDGYQRLTTAIFVGGTRTIKLRKK